MAKDRIVIGGAIPNYPDREGQNVPEKIVVIEDIYLDQSIQKRRQMTCAGYFAHPLRKQGFRREIRQTGGSF